jgi:hypothetical protein
VFLNSRRSVAVMADAGEVVVDEVVPFAAGFAEGGLTDDLGMTAGALSGSESSDLGEPEVADAEVVEVLSIANSRPNFSYANLMTRPDQEVQAMIGLDKAAVAQIVERIQPFAPVGTPAPEARNKVCMFLARAYSGLSNQGIANNVKETAGFVLCPTAISRAIDAVCQWIVIEGQRHGTMGNVVVRGSLTWGETPAFPNDTHLVLSAVRCQVLQKMPDQGERKWMMKTWNGLHGRGLVVIVLLNTMGQVVYASPVGPANARPADLMRCDAAFLRDQKDRDGHPIGVTVPAALEEQLKDILPGARAARWTANPLGKQSNSAPFKAMQEYASILKFGDVAANRITKGAKGLFFEGVSESAFFKAQSDERGALRGNALQFQTAGMMMQAVLTVHEAARGAIEAFTWNDFTSTEPGSWHASELGQNFSAKLATAPGIDSLLRSEDKHVGTAEAAPIQMWEPAQRWSRSGRQRAPTAPSGSIRQPDTPYATGTGMLKKAQGLVGKHQNEALALAVRTAAKNLAGAMAALEQAEGRPVPRQLVDDQASLYAVSDQGTASPRGKRANPLLGVTPPLAAKAATQMTAETAEKAGLLSGKGRKPAPARRAPSKSPTGKPIRRKKQAKLRKMPEDTSSASD